MGLTYVIYYKTFFIITHNNIRDAFTCLRAKRLSSRDIVKQTKSRLDSSSIACNVLQTGNITAVYLKDNVNGRYDWNDIWLVGLKELRKQH